MLCCCTKTRPRVFCALVFYRSKKQSMFVVSGTRGQILEEKTGHCVCGIPEMEGLLQEGYNAQDLGSASRGKS